MFIKIWGGRRLYIERDRWSGRAPFLEWRRQQREILIWVGPLHIIYTPADWAPAAGESILDRRAA
jgi:hypothetical protein